MAALAGQFFSDVDHPRKGDDARRPPEEAEAVNSLQTILTWEGSMSSSTAARATGRGGHYAEREGYGLIIFAFVLLLVLSFFNLIDGIAAVANSHVFIANAHYVFGDLRTWGWITLIIGVLQLLAAGGILTGQPAGPLVCGGPGRAQRYRPDVLHPRLPVLVPHDHRRGRSCTPALCLYGSRQNLAS